MSEKEKVVSQERGLPFFKLIKKNITLMIIVTILCAGLFFGYVTLNKPSTTHTASCGVIISTRMGDVLSEKDVVYTQLYIATIKSIAESDTLEKTVDEYYKEESNGYAVKGSINRGNFLFSYNQNSLIVKLSYVDVDAQVAKDKLDSYINVLGEELERANGTYLNSKYAKLEKLQEEFVVSTNNIASQSAITGVLVGLVISVAIAFIRYFVSGKVNGIEDLEEATKVKTLATLK